jgi:hypothetical protein
MIAVVLAVGYIIGVAYPGPGQGIVSKVSGMTS